jgi:hypothetical protein
MMLGERRVCKMIQAASGLHQQAALAETAQAFARNAKFA